MIASAHQSTLPPKVTDAFRLMPRAEDAVTEPARSPARLLSSCLRYLGLRYLGLRYVGLQRAASGEADIARARADLQDASERLLTAQEDERHRIAIELHDSTSQHLVALGMGVARLRRTLDASGASAGVLKEMDNSLREAVKEIRVFSYLMNPPSLRRDGLETSVRNFVRGFGTRTGLEVAFQARGALDEVGSCVQHTAFRVVQEALSNVYRHAQASRVEVELAQHGGRLTVRVADDGKGIGPLAAMDIEGVQLGVGIPGMRARVAQFDGTLDLAGNGSGTVLLADIPLRSNVVRSFSPTAKASRNARIAEKSQQREDARTTRAIGERARSFAAGAVYSPADF